MSDFDVLLREAEALPGGWPDDEPAEAAAERAWVTEALLAEQVKTRPWLLP